jgi:hypothetical protein
MAYVRHVRTVTALQVIVNLAAHEHRTAGKEERRPGRVAAGKGEEGEGVITLGTKPERLMAPGVWQVGAASCYPFDRHRQPSGFVTISIAWESEGRLNPS